MVGYLTIRLLRSRSTLGTTYLPTIDSLIGLEEKNLSELIVNLEIYLFINFIKQMSFKLTAVITYMTGSRV